MEERLLFLASVFAIDVAAYAVMSNHTHVVVHVDKSEALNWSVDEVLKRYHRLHCGTLLTQKFVKGDELSPGESTINLYRHPL